MPPRRWITLLVLLTLTACGPTASSVAPRPATPTTVQLRGRLTFAGSTTVQPLVDKLGAVFTQLNPDVALEIAAGGSVVGIKAIHQGTTDIGMSSRALHEDEQAGITTHQIASDVLAVVVNPANRVQALTQQQLIDIYLGKITSWRELGGADLPITVVVREESSGTRGAFDEIALRKQTPAAPRLSVAITAGDVAATVAGDVGAIGYLGFGNVDVSVSVVAIDGVVPSVATVRDGSYRLVRPLLLLSGPLSQPLAQAFIDFVLSDAGQRLVAEDGWAPVR
jgi:phosphate transport system substrate-binding protein